MKEEIETDNEDTNNQENARVKCQVERIVSRNVCDGFTVSKGKDGHWMSFENGKSGSTVNVENIFAPVHAKHICKWIDRQLHVDDTRKMEVKLTVSIKDDFAEGVGPSKVYHCFLSLDGMLFEIGRFYEGPHMNAGTSERLERVLEFGKLCDVLFNG